MSDKMRVLIVDDEPEIGNLLKLFLEDDFDVTIFTDPRLACEEVTKSAYKLVVSDIKMPFLTGLDVVKHVKKVRPETPRLSGTKRGLKNLGPRESYLSRSVIQVRLSTT